MAEYREFHCPYGDDFEGGDECDRCEKYELCMETPSADVIERENVKNLIETAIEDGWELDYALERLKEI